MERCCTFTSVLFALWSLAARRLALNGDWRVRTLFQCLRCMSWVVCIFACLQAHHSSSLVVSASETVLFFCQPTNVSVSLPYFLSVYQSSFSVTLKFCLSAYQSICQPTSLSASLPISLPTYQSVCQPTIFSVTLKICLSAYQPSFFVSLPSVCQPTNLSASLPICLPAYQYACQPISLVFLSVCQSVC